MSEEPEVRGTGGVEDAVENGASGTADGGAGDSEKDTELHELRRKLEIKESTVRELHEELARARVLSDESVAAREMRDERIEELRVERVRLKEKASELEEELRQRRRGRENLDRQIERMQRDLDYRDGEISRRDNLLKRRDEELEALASESEVQVSRKEGALEDSLRRVAGLEKDLEEREYRISALEDQVSALRSQVKREREERERLAEPANRLRAGIELFNDSRHRETVNTLSRTLGQPNVRVALERGDEPAAILTFTWRGMTWQTYVSDPGLAVREPRVRLSNSGEDLSGVDEKTPNARIGPGGRVTLGL